MGCFGVEVKQLTYKILLLDESEFLLTFQPHRKGQELLDQVFAHLNLVETEYFGLRVIDPEDNQLHWLEEDKPVYKQVKSPSWSLFFAVRFYAPDPGKLCEEVTRFQFYLQVRRDIAQGKVGVTNEVAAQLGALVVQAELGDHDAQRHAPGYVDRIALVPNQTEQLNSAVMNLHPSLAGQPPAVAEMLFLQKVKWLDLYGVDKHKVTGDGNTSYTLGLIPTGIVILRNETRVGNYLWPRITKLSRKKEQFVLRVRDKATQESLFAFRLKSKAAAKHLFKCAEGHHAFFTTTRSPNPDVAHRLGAGVSSAPVRKTRFRDGFGSVKPSPARLEAKLGKMGEVGVAPAQARVVVAPSPVSVVDGRVVTKTDKNSSSLDSPLERKPASAAAPWEEGACATTAPTGGLYTSVGASPLSTRSSHSSRYQRRRPQSASETEMSYKRHHTHHSRRSAEVGGRLPKEDAEKPAPGGRAGRRKKSRGSRASRGDGETASDSSRKSAKGGLHQRDAAGEVMVDSGTQWAQVQRSNLGNEKENIATTQKLPRVTLHAGETASRKQRAGRSKSPKASKALPPEILLHINHDLIDPCGFSDEQLRDIPFMKVETRERPRRISPHGKTGAKSPKASHAQRSQDDEKLQMASYRHAHNGAANVIKTARVAPMANNNNNVLAARPRNEETQERARGDVGAMPTSGGGAFYFPNGIPSGYFSDTTSVGVWADDEMEAEV